MPSILALDNSALSASAKAGWPDCASAKEIGGCCDKVAKKMTFCGCEAHWIALWVARVGLSLCKIRIAQHGVVDQSVVGPEVGSWELQNQGANALGGTIFLSWFWWKSEARFCWHAVIRNSAISILNTVNVENGNKDSAKILHCTIAATTIAGWIRWTVCWDWRDNLIGHFHRELAIRWLPLVNACYAG